MFLIYKHLMVTKGYQWVVNMVKGITEKKVTFPDQKACHYISYAVQNFDIYMRFLWSTAHGKLLHFVYCSEIWHLHEIPLVNDTWYAVTFPILFRNLKISLVNDTWHAITLPILFRNLTSTWNFLGQNAVTFPIMLKIYTRFTVFFLCEKVRNM